MLVFLWAGATYVVLDVQDLARVESIPGEDRDGNGN